LEDIEAKIEMEIYNEIGKEIEMDTFSLQKLRQAELFAPVIS